MSEGGRHGDFTPLMRVEVQRADVVGLVRKDLVLAGCELCRALGPALDAVLKKSIARRYPDKVVLFQAGESGSSLHLVLEGEVRLYARKDKDSIELPAARKGDVLGEGEVLDGSGVRAVSAVAHGVVVLTEIPRETLLTGGRLTPAVAATLEAVRKKRSASLDELNDFLNRW